MANIYVMSDIHGYLNIFKRNFELIDLASKENKLIILGDFISRGPNSLEVLKLVQSLSLEYQDQVIVLLGNNEKIFVDWLDNAFMNFEAFVCKSNASTIKSFVNDSSVDQELFNQLESSKTIMDNSQAYATYLSCNYADEINWLKSLFNQDLYYETKDQIFVHAGINEELEDYWQDLSDENDYLAKYPATLGKFSKDIIAGHIGTEQIGGKDYLGKVYYDGYNHIYIDGSVYDSGIIPLLRIDTKTNHYYQVYKNHEVLIK